MRILAGAHQIETHGAASAPHTSSEIIDGEDSTHTFKVVFTARVQVTTMTTTRAVRTARASDSQRGVNSSKLGSKPKGCVEAAPHPLQR